MANDLSKLPELCGWRMPSDGKPVVLKRGVKGYWPAPEGFVPEKFNKSQGITPAQELAMQIGSMAGFDVPGADPDRHIDRLKQQGLM